MGFRISVKTDVKSSCDNENSVSREYYSFISSYDWFGDESILAQVGKYTGLDLQPLTNLLYLDADFEEYRNSGFQNLKSIYRLVNSFHEKLKSSPELIHSIQYNFRKMYNQKEKFQEYFISGKIMRDLELILNDLNRYDKRGVEKVLFVAG